MNILKLFNNARGDWQLDNIVHRAKTLTKTINNSVSKNSLLKGILLIGGGTAASQVIGTLAMLIITHIYTPTDFGILAVYGSILSIVALISSLRYELAIPLPKDDIEAANILILCLLLTIISASILTIITILCGSYLIPLLNIQQLIPYLWLIFIGFIGLNIYQILNYWAIRKRDYSRITYTKLNQSISGALCKIILGVLSFGTYGLLIGDIVSKVSGIGTFISIILKQDLLIFKKISIKGIFEAAKEYYKFPVYTFSSSILNTVALQLPIIAISILYGLQEAGYYSLANSVLYIPMSLIGGAISMAFFGEIAALIREDPKKLESTYKNVTLKLLLLSLPIILGISIVAPYLFPLIFGGKWIKAGIYCLPLALIIIPMMTISPTSYLETYGFNTWVLIWDFVRTVLLLGGFYIVYLFNLQSINAVYVYGLIMAVMYIIYYFMSISAIRRLSKN